MKTTKILFGQERHFENSNIFINVSLLAPQEQRENLQSYVSTAFDGMVLEFAGDANNKTDHWRIAVPGGTRENAQLIAEEITHHLTRLANEADEELDMQYTPELLPKI